MFELRVLALTLLACGAAGVACGKAGASPSPTAPPRTGIVVVAVLSPTCPGPEHPGEHCSKPLSIDVTVTTLDGATAAKAHTDSAGRTTVALSPGTYTVSGAARSSGGLGAGNKPAPVTATVTTGRYTSVELDYSTGIE
jgi:hypothetical protein